MRPGRWIRVVTILVILTAAACAEEEPPPQAEEAEAPSSIDPTNPRSPLDLREATGDHEGKRMTFTVTMHREWSLKDLERPNKLLVHISTDPKNEAYNRFLNVTSNGGLLCEFFYADGTFIGTVPSSRSDDRSVSCSVKTRHLPKWERHLAWVAESKALPEASEAGRPRIADRAPDSGLYEFGKGVVITDGT